MNWQEKFVQIIIKQYPKSIALMRGNFKSSQIWKLQYMSNPRLLYDFFDGQDIYIEIERDYDYVGRCGEEIKYTDTWNYNLVNQYGAIGYGEDFTTRTLAEEQAFLKAFEILEDKL